MGLHAEEKMKTFRNRTEAGRFLANRLKPTYADRSDVLVLDLPRGGVPVASEIATVLQAPLDICIVRKLGVQGHQELAMGAIAENSSQTSLINRGRNS